MKHYVGLDVSLKEVSICVIDADGVVAAEGTNQLSDRLLQAERIPEDFNEHRGTSGSR